VAFSNATGEAAAFVQPRGSGAWHVMTARPTTTIVNIRATIRRLFLVTATEIVIAKSCSRVICGPELFRTVTRYYILSIL
jgi:hypothetical protein